VSPLPFPSRLGFKSNSPPFVVLHGFSPFSVARVVKSPPPPFFLSPLFEDRDGTCPPPFPDVEERGASPLLGTGGDLPPSFFPLLQRGKEEAFPPPPLSSVERSYTPRQATESRFLPSLPG